MDICLHGDSGLIMCTDSVSEVQDSDVVATGGGELGMGTELQQDPEMDICLLRDMGLIMVRWGDSESDLWDSGTGGWERGRETELIDIWARRALGGTSASLEGICCGLAETEGFVDKPDSAWLSSSSSSLSSFSSSSGPSDSSPSES